MGIARTKSNESSQRVEAGHPHEAKRENRNSLRKHKGVSKKIKKVTSFYQTRKLLQPSLKIARKTKTGKMTHRKNKKKALHEKKPDFWC